MNTYDFVTRDRQGQDLSITYMLEGSHLWFVAFFDHTPYSAVEHVYMHRLGDN